MGRKLLDTIALQMKNKAPLADIARMLQSLRENLVLQQQDADVTHAANEADCSAEIAGYNRRIDFASNEVQESTAEINQLTSMVNQLTMRIENIATQLEILTKQEELLRSTRTAEEEAYAKRQQQTREVIEALNMIATKLGSIEPETDAAAVLLDLHKMGKSNPIAALVSLASAFSPERLANVQQKMGELRASIEQSIVDDAEDEHQAQIDFRTIVRQITNQRTNLAAARIEANTLLTQNKNALALQKKRNEDASKELTAATTGLNQKEAECDAQRSQYQRDSEHRQKEIGIIRQVEEILATKLEGASSYLQERMETL